MSACTADNVGSAVSCPITPQPLEFEDGGLCASDFDAFFRVINGFEDAIREGGYSCEESGGGSESEAANEWYEHLFALDGIPW